MLDSRHRDLYRIRYGCRRHIAAAPEVRHVHHCHRRSRQAVSLIEQVDDDHEAVEIVSKKGTAFLVGSDEYRSLRETAYLLRSPANAERLHRSVAAARADQTQEHDLLQPEE